MKSVFFSLLILTALSGCGENQPDNIQIHTVRYIVAQEFALPLTASFLAGLLLFHVQKCDPRWME